MLGLLPPNGHGAQLQAAHYHLAATRRYLCTLTRLDSKAL